MTNAFERKHGAAIARYEFGPARHVRLTVRGPVTPSVLSALAVDLERIALGVLAQSILTDYSRAALAVTYEQMVQAPARYSLAMQALPIAIVTAIPVRELFSEYAWAMAKLGLLRGVFGAPDSADSWVRKKATPALALHCRIQESAR